MSVHYHVRTEVSLPCGCAVTHTYQYSDIDGALYRVEGFLIEAEAAAREQIVVGSDVAMAACYDECFLDEECPHAGPAPQGHHN